MPMISTSLTADSLAPASARSVLSEFLGAELSNELALDAELLTSELVTNSVMHSGLVVTDLIWMELSLTEERLRVTISDADVLFDRGETPNRRDRRDLGGWGLVLVERVSDRWGIVRNEPNSVWFELDR
jgi:anti-sigma regulatory factor (Ser/Thr protein kinase)